MEPITVTDRTRIRRISERQNTDRRALHDLLDAGLVAHVAMVRDNAPMVIPLSYARSGNALLLHGSTGGGLLRAAADGATIAVGVTILDALVYARSTFDSSMNYRSAMIIGTGHALSGEAKVDGLRRIAEHLMPGRWDEVRPPTAKELAATLVLEMQLDEASVKIRADGATTDPNDGESREVWAGILPLHTQAAAPIAASDVPRDVSVPRSLALAAARHG